MGGELIFSAQINLNRTNCMDAIGGLQLHVYVTVRLQVHQQTSKEAITEYHNATKCRHGYVQ